MDPATHYGRPTRACPKCEKESPATAPFGGTSLSSTFFCANCREHFSGSVSIAAKNNAQEACKPGWTG